MYLNRTGQPESGSVFAWWALGAWGKDLAEQSLSGLENLQYGQNQ